MMPTMAPQLATVDPSRVSPHAVDDEGGHGAHAEAGRALDEAGGEHGRAAVRHHEHDAADDGEHEGEAGHGSAPEGVGDAPGEQGVKATPVGR